MKNFYKYLLPILTLAPMGISCKEVYKYNDFETSAEYTADSAYAYYYGEDEGTDNYGLSLFVGQIDENEYQLASRGVELYLELFSPATDGLEPAAGEYKAQVSTTSSADHYYMTGTIQSGTVYGSYLGTKKSDVDGMEYDIVSNGSVKLVKTSTGKFMIEAKVLAADEWIEFEYEGNLDVIDLSDEGNGGGGDVTEGADYEFSGFTQGEIDYCGTEGGLSYWAIYLGDNNVDLSDLSGTGKLACLELCTSSTSKTTLPTGKYVVSETDGNFVLLPVYEYSDNGDTYLGGTMFCEGDNILVGATSGYADIS